MMMTMGKIMFSWSNVLFREILIQNDPRMLEITDQKIKKKKLTGSQGSLEESEED